MKVLRPYVKEPPQKRPKEDKAVQLWSTGNGKATKAC